MPKAKTELPSCSLVSHLLGRMWLRVFGWKIIGKISSGTKFVMIAAPHTSNWDFPFMLAVMCACRIRVAWIGKHTLFKKPFGFIMKWLGGLPVDRSKKNGTVEQIAEMFQKTSRLIIAVSPPGTRKKRDYWKSGFYWIATHAQVPILCGYLDYARKEAKVGLSFLPTGDVKNDMEKIRKFYCEARGKHPELMTSIRLRDEENEH